MIHLILWVALIGVIVYLVTKFIPMPQPFIIVIYVIAGICIIFLLMNAFGMSDIPVPGLRR